MLAREAWARKRLLAYAQKTACIETPWFSLSVQVTADGLLVAGPVTARESRTASPDVTLTVLAGAITAFLQGGQVAAMRQVKIVGDAEFASTLGQLAEHLRWEPEEDLAQLIGDAPAHQLVAYTRSTLTQARSSGQSFLESLAEYFLDENPQLVRQARLAQMRDELVSLRDAVARLEKRVERVARHAPPASQPSLAQAVHGCH